MLLLKKKLARLSLCACGFPFLNVKIPLGFEYRIPRYNAMGVEGKLICGGCGNETPIRPIMVINSAKSIEWLPMELFDWDETTETVEEGIGQASPRTAPAGQAGEAETKNRSRL